MQSHHIADLGRGLMNKYNYNAGTLRQSEANPSRSAATTKPRLTIARVRANVAAAGYAALSKSEQRQRTNTIIRAAIAETNDPRLDAAVAKRRKADQRLERSRQYAHPRKHRRKSPTQSLGSRAPRHRYARGQLDGCSYFEVKRAMKAAARQEHNQAGFPNVLRHPVAIMLCILPTEANLKDETNRARPGLRNIFGGLSQGVRVDGSFHNEIKYAHELKEMFPVEEWPDGFDPVAEPTRMWAVLHLHAVICDPWMTKNEIRRYLKDRLPGCRRNCVRRVLPVVTLEDGTETRGAQGYLEYAQINKPRADMGKPQDTARAIIEFSKMDITWCARSRTFKYGKTLEDSGVVLNPDRLRYIEQQDRLQWIKDHWDKLSFAEQFVHIWRSGIVGTFRSSIDWTVLFGRGSQSISALLRNIRNWATADAAKDTDFIVYLGIPQRE